MNRRFRNWHLLAVIAAFFIAAPVFGWSAAGIVLGLGIGFIAGVSYGVVSVVVTEVRK